MGGKVFKTVVKVGSLGLIDPSTPKAPGTPNYSGLAAQDAQAQRNMAQEITQWNRPTQINDSGKIGWTKDDAGNWTQTETLDPTYRDSNKSAIDLLQRKQYDLSQQGKFTPDQVAQFDPNSGRAAADAMYKSYMSRAQPQQQTDVTNLTTKLRQQGLQPGTEAFDRAMKNTLTAQGDVNSKANLDSLVYGGNEARQNYASQLAGNSQKYSQALKNYQLPWEVTQQAQEMANNKFRVNPAGFSGATGYNPADMTGAAQNSYNAKFGNYNSQMQKKGNTLGAAGNAAAMFA